MTHTEYTQALDAAIDVLLNARQTDHAHHTQLDAVGAMRANGIREGARVASRYWGPQPRTVREIDDCDGVVRFADGGQCARVPYDVRRVR